LDGFVSLEDVYRFPDSLETYTNRPTNGKVVGINANLWTEQAITQERRDFLTFPRLLATAEAAWTLKENKNWETFFSSRLKNHLPLLEARGLTIFNPYSITTEIPR
jgi:hexosaminidase